MIYGIVLCLCVLWHVVLPQSHLEWPSCSGGSSLLGLDEWKDKSQRCCELSGVCHGYDSGSVATEVVGSLQNLLNATLPIQKSRIKRLLILYYHDVKIGLVYPCCVLWEIGILALVMELFSLKKVQL